MSDEIQNGAVETDVTEQVIEAVEEATTTPVEATESSVETTESAETV